MGVFQMSLINQMLQDLDARRADMAGTTQYGEQVRAVPERRGTHPAWWLVLALAIALAGLLAWLLLRPAAVPMHEAQPHLPLKLDTGMAASTSPTMASSGNILPQSAPSVPTPKQAAMAPAAEAALTIDSPPAAEAQTAAPSALRTTGKPATARAAETRSSPRDMLPPALLDTSTVLPATTSLVAASREKSPAAPSPITSNKQFKELTPQQQAENAYRKALLPLQQGKAAEAIGGLEAALQLDPQHVGARQALIGVLLDEKRPDDAARRAREGLALDAHQSGLAMILARLQLDKGELRPAIDTLEHTLPYAADHADYQAFLAALLQRDDKHKQAVEHYLHALQTAPQNGVWWMGLGISLQAEQRLAEAREAFTRAKGTNTLSAELLAFVEARLGQLPR
jgi:MSHA biogenesis protein MshN